MPENPPPPPPSEDNSTAPPPPPPAEDSITLLPPPPPPPPEDQETLRDSIPLPPPLPEKSDSPHPEVDQSLLPKEQLLNVLPSNPLESTNHTIKPRRKRRFSPSAQDSIGSTTNTPKSTTSSTITSRIQSSSTSERLSEHNSTKSKTLTANQWEKTAFVGDTSGEKRMKFLRLMGLGKSAKIDAKPEDEEDASREASRRQQQSLDMERQYEQGRKRQYRFR
ncbi:hypothetical protein FBU30_005941 [Linnemannia zychae]|nr:hypothetical protein FBU30_005941 [Linnemannia zychae]